MMCSFLTVSSDNVANPSLGHNMGGVGTDGVPKGSALGPDWSSHVDLKAGSVSACT